MRIDKCAHVAVHTMTTDGDMESILGLGHRGANSVVGALGCSVEGDRLGLVLGLGSGLLGLRLGFAQRRRNKHGFTFQ